jgi:hypothetical protein
VRPGCLANQLAASLPHIAPKDGEPIFVTHTMWYLQSQTYGCPVCSSP